MRVKIAYTVELEEVEKEVAEIMEKAANNLDKAYRQLVDLQEKLDTNTGDLTDKLETIDLIRRKMMKADQVLEDCHSILHGYGSAIIKIEEQENEIKNG